MEYLSAKSILYKTKDTSWFGAEYNMNIYRGCNHGCIYCDSRSECYRLPEFETVKAKADSARIIRDNLRSKSKRGVVSTGSMSDPYNSFEEELGLTRQALSLLHAYEFGVDIATKGTLVTRDIDILKDIQKAAPVLVKITITCAEDALSQIIEPGAPPSSKRFEAIHALSEAGIFCGVLLMPVLPFINDTEDNIRGIVQKAAQNGARFVYPAMGMTLRTGNREYFYKELDRHFPGVKERYQKTFGDKYQCLSPKVSELWSVFKAECDKTGLLYKMKDIVSASRLGTTDRQMSLFD